MYLCFLCTVVSCIHVFPLSSLYSQMFLLYKSREGDQSGANQCYTLACKCQSPDADSGPLRPRMAIHLKRYQCNYVLWLLTDFTNEIKERDSVNSNCTVMLLLSYWLSWDCANCPETVTHSPTMLRIIPSSRALSPGQPGPVQRSEALS